MTYAADTRVPVERSRGELERTLKRYGATRFAYAQEPDIVTVAFELDLRRVRLRIPMPNPAEYTHTRGGVRRTDNSWAGAVEQAERARWRAVVLVVKAKLESVEAGIETLEEAFLAWLLVPGTGRTVGEDVVPRIEQAYESGETPLLLPKL